MKIFIGNSIIGFSIASYSFRPASFDIGVLNKFMIRLIPNAWIISSLGIVEKKFGIYQFHMVLRTNALITGVTTRNAKK
jgi:hypothetical protein